MAKGGGAVNVNLRPRTLEGQIRQGERLTAAGLGSRRLTRQLAEARAAVGRARPVRGGGRGRAGRGKKKAKRTRRAR